MKRYRRSLLALLLMAAIMLPTATPAHGSIPTGTQVVLIFVAVGAIGAGIGIAVYHVAHRPPSVTGCSASSSTGLTLTDEANQQLLPLAGDTGDLKARERVKITGRNEKNRLGKVFQVDKLRKDYGPCPATP